MSALVDFIELAYDVHASPRDWLLGLAAGMRKLLGEDRGVVGFFYDASDPSRVSMSTTVTLEENAAVVTALELAHTHGPAWGAKRLYWGGVRCATVSQALGSKWSQMAIFRTIVAPHGVKDFFALRSCDPDRHGVLLSAALRKQRRVSSPEAEVWERLGAHVAAGARLRTNATSADLSSGAAAVISADGRVEHAEGDLREAATREAVNAAAKRMDRARGRMRRESPEEAVAIWTALVDGRWSLVDWIDHDGRRFLIARENPTPAKPARDLTKRERAVMALVAEGDSNKLVAYELGISEASVGVHLHNASRKLAARSRVDAIAKYRSYSATREFSSIP